MLKMSGLLYEGLKKDLPFIRLNGHQELRLPNTLSISFKNLAANRILDVIGTEVAASAGAACHSETVELSHVLTAIKLPSEWAQGTIRFSTGRMTTEREIKRALRIIVDNIAKIKNQNTD